MGVTIHFAGRLRSSDALTRALETATRFATARGWQHRSLAKEHVRLARVRDEEDWDYVGPVFGIELLPHERADPVRLEFDKDLYIQEYTKTQFAGVATHAAVVALLRELIPFFEDLQVEDEGELWDTADTERLAQHIEACNRALADELQKHPSATGPVKLPSGRWVDIIS